MCITYNHINTIRDTLEGFLMQKTDFAYEVFIYDDASTDGTSDIVNEYVYKYPHIFKAVISKVNIWKNPERNKMYQEMRQKYLTGKYRALCEGDDFWIDCNKLQIQVDYMERHPECVMYLHNAIWFNCKTGVMKAGNPFGEGVNEREVSAEEVILQRYGNPPTASFLYRRELEDYPEFFLDSPVGDYSLLLYALTRGNIYYSNRIMSVYRFLGQGSYTSNLQVDINLLIYHWVGLLNFLCEYDKYTRNFYHKWCVSQIHSHAVSAIYSAQRDISMKDHIRHCREEGYSLKENAMDVVDKLELFRYQWCDEQYVSDKVKGFIRHYRHVYIMGTGKCASMLAMQLANNKINYEGFVMTLKDKDLFMNKPVYSLSQIPQYDSVGILVGINPTSHLLRDELLSVLQSARINNYFFPFAFDHIEHIELEN